MLGEGMATSSKEKDRRWGGQPVLAVSSELTRQRALCCIRCGAPDVQVGHSAFAPASIVLLILQHQLVRLHVLLYTPVTRLLFYGKG
eukprot:3922643-Rhodomonas_salina.2